MRTTNDPHIISNTYIFIDDKILQVTPIAYAQLRHAMLLRMLNVFNGFVIITTHNVGTDNSCVVADT